MDDARRLVSERMIRFSYGTGVALRPDTDSDSVADAVAAEVRTAGSATMTLRAQDQLPRRLIDAAADAIAPYPEVVMLYVLGDGANFDPEDLTPFRVVHHLNLNVRKLASYKFLAKFTALRTLTIQGSSPRAVPLGFLAPMQNLIRLTVPSAVRDAETIGACGQLRFFRCSSDESVFGAVARHPALQYLAVNRGTNRDLQALATMPALLGVEIYQVRGLDGEDLAPLGGCASLNALSLGALSHVTHLAALRGGPRHTLRALLLEKLPNLADLTDIGQCEVLDQLGLYESRPKDKRLEPLRQLTNLAHLALGDPYPATEVSDLNRWYSGAIHYRNLIRRGNLAPRWRTPIDELV